MKFTKLMMAAAGAFLFAGSLYAENWTVYSNGSLAQNTTPYGWWNAVYSFDANDPAGSSNQVMSFNAGAANTAVGSFGLLLDGKPYVAALAESTLTFKWYATGTGKIALKMTSTGLNGAEDTSKSQEINILTITDADLNKWNTATVNMSQTFPTTTAAWTSDNNNGGGYVFAPVLSDGAEGAVFYFNDIVYNNIKTDVETPDVPVLPTPTTVPVPTQNSDEVFSLFSSKYTAGSSFSVEGWGSSTQANLTSIDGSNVYELKAFNYLGWQLPAAIDISAYKFMHVDYWTPDGTGFGFTPITTDGGTKEYGWVASTVNKEAWNQYDVELSYFADGGVNLAVINQIKFDNGGGAQGYLANVYFWGEADDSGNTDPGTPSEPGATWYGSGSCSDPANFTVEFKAVSNGDGSFTVYANVINTDNKVGVVPQWGYNGGGIVPLDASTDSNYSYMGTSSATFKDGDNTGLFFYIAYDGNAARVDVDYVYGSSNEQPAPAPVLTADASEITSTSAQINYLVTLPDELEGADVFVYIDGMQASASPIVLSQLTPSTSYSYTLTATASLNGKDYNSSEVVVTFNTLRDATQPEPVYRGSVAGTLPNCWIYGVNTNDTREDVEVAFAYSITYNNDQTLTVDVDVDNDNFSKIAGMNFQLKIGANFTNFTMVDTRSVSYTATTGQTYQEGDELQIELFCPYDGAAYTAPAINYTVGDSLTNVVKVEEMAEGLVDIYTLSGVKVASGVDFNAVRSSLTPGLYIVGGKKLIVR